MDAPHGFTSTDAVQLTDVAAALPPSALAVVDFDGTLLLGNSTQLYLQTLRPRFLARPLLSLLELARPWRMLPGKDPSWLYRDWIRVILLTLILPWSPALWRRSCAAIARRDTNTGLIQALSARPPGTVVVATYGFHFLVAPLLASMGRAWPLAVSAPFLTGFRLRRTGKADAMRRLKGEAALSQSILITDSGDDRDFVPLCRQVFLLLPDGRLPAMSVRNAYLPLQYMHHCKRRGENTIVRVILFYDLIALWLAYAPASGHWLVCCLGLLLFHLAFWTIYELGNWENDVLGAAYEDSPRIPPGFAEWRERMQPRQAWIWAAGLGVPSALCLASSLAAPTTLWPAPGLSIALFAALMAYLAASRAVYALYNRVDPRTRVFVYPLLQVSKGVALALFLPVFPAGFLFLVSVVLVRELRYVSYRHSGSRRGLDVPINLLIAACYIFLCAVLCAVAGPAPSSFWIVAVGIMVWHVQRGRRDIMDLSQEFEWLPHRGVSVASAEGQVDPTVKIKALIKDLLPASWRLRRSVEHAKERGEPELRFLPVLCKSDRTSLDVGANRGVYSFVMRRYSKSVVAFEPNRHYASFLRRALKDVTLHDIAASDREGTATLRVPYREAVAGMGTIEEANILQEANHSSDVRTAKLDSLVLPPVGFMKIDVEGHELAVLTGAEALIERDRPNLLIEAEDRHRTDAVGSIVRYLARYGYRGFFFSNDVLHPIEHFETSVHQKLSNDTHRHNGGYINNFIFVPSAEVEQLTKIAPISV